ncbi:restriction endonuclease subunit S [Intestinimonas massiliensis]|uniref:Restriction endonuclease subunit S n=1 Tax=Intestinimonas massiliensis (ex Afouda et al. 2020) TaxID=1673721 RepID=A0AAW5JP67_9FIRM|nr:restriction endonuclease subunit S [Intestinimonas massiliensis (ex Afouda et al. 2020)]MCQ4770311.1 restriction endonuclease subunit S [Intestinimonas massiliensis (ex Afouda et al. 2020)]
MREGYDVLGKYISLVDERNRDLSITNLLGVSIEKRFIPSIANIVGTDLSSYKIVRTGQFAYGPVTSRNGEKMSIALLAGADCIISSSYTVFEIKDKNHLDAEYLMLWFSRPEFDRYARYRSHGSVREIFDWEEMCSVELPVPEISKQKEIVKAYRAITDRIELKRKINDNLVATSDTIFSEMFLKSKAEPSVSFTDIVQLMGGGTPKTDDDSFWNGDVLFFTPKDVTDSPFCISTEKHLSLEGLNNCSSKLYPAFTTFVTCRGTVGNLSMAGVPMAMNQSCYALKGKVGYPALFVYAFTRYVIATMKRKASGAVFSALVTRDFEMEKVFFPNQTDAILFQERVTPLYDTVLANTKEIQALRDIQNNILTQLSRR